MINITPELVESLGAKLALANNPSFLWRQLTLSPTVVNAAEHSDATEIAASLQDLLEREALAEDESIAAYVLLAALLQGLPDTAPQLDRLVGVERLYWGPALVRHVSASARSTEHSTVYQQPVVTRSTPQSSGSTSRLILPYSSDR